jgi:hypothetical protein
MKLKRLRPHFFTSALLAALVAFSFAALADPPTLNLNGATGTTATSAAAGANGGPVATGNARTVDIQVWSAAGGTYTVLLEERAYNQNGTAGPWTLVATMANCGADGIGTVNGTGSTVCGFSTLAPKSETRLRVSARSSGTIYGTVHMNRGF